jgi:hypothetical protein
MAYIGEQQFRQQQGGGFDPYKILSVMALLNRMGGSQQPGVTDAGVLLKALGDMDANMPSEMADELLDKTNEFDWSPHPGMEAVKDMMVSKYTHGLEQEAKLRTNLEELEEVGNIVEKQLTEGGLYSAEDRNRIFQSIEWLRKNETVIDDYAGDDLNQTFDRYFSGFKLGLETERAGDILGRVGDPREKVLMDMMKEGKSLMTPEGPGFFIPDQKRKGEFLASLDIDEISAKIPVITETDDISDRVNWLRNKLKITKEGLELETDQYGDMLPSDVALDTVDDLKERIAVVQSQILKGTDLFEGEAGSYVKGMALVNKQTMDALDVVMQDVSGGSDQLAIMWNEGAEPASILAVNRAWHMPSAQRGGGMTPAQKTKYAGDMVRSYIDVLAKNMRETVGATGDDFMIKNLSDLPSWTISTQPTTEMLGTLKGASSVEIVRFLNEYSGMLESPLDKIMGTGAYSIEGKKVNTKDVIQAAIDGNTQFADEIVSRFWELYVHGGGEAEGEWRSTASMILHDEGGSQYSKVENLDFSNWGMNIGDEKRRALKAYLNYWKFTDDMMKYPWGSIHDVLGQLFGEGESVNYDNMSDLKNILSGDADLSTLAEGYPVSPFHARHDMSFLGLDDDDDDVMTSLVNMINSSK